MVSALLKELEDEEDWKEIQQALADSENAIPLEWDPGRYGDTVQNSESGPRKEIYRR
jgi:hypothetical protein